MIFGARIERSLLQPLPQPLVKHGHENGENLAKQPGCQSYIIAAAQLDNDRAGFLQQSFGPVWPIKQRGKRKSRSEKGVRGQKGVLGCELVDTIPVSALTTSRVLSAFLAQESAAADFVLGITSIGRQPFPQPSSQQRPPWLRPDNQRDYCFSHWSNNMIMGAERSGRL